MIAHYVFKVLLSFLQETLDLVDFIIKRSFEESLLNPELFSFALRVLFLLSSPLSLLPSFICYLGLECLLLQRLHFFLHLDFGSLLSPASVAMEFTTFSPVQTAHFIVAHACEIHAKLDVH